MTTTAKNGREKRRGRSRRGRRIAAAGTPDTARNGRAAQKTAISPTRCGALLPCSGTARLDSCLFLSINSENILRAVPWNRDVQGARYLFGAVAAGPHTGRAWRGRLEESHRFLSCLQSTLIFMGAFLLRRFLWSFPSATCRPWPGERLPSANITSAIRSPTPCTYLLARTGSDRIFLSFFFAIVITGLLCFVHHGLLRPAACNRFVKAAVLWLRVIVAKTRRPNPRKSPRPRRCKARRRRRFGRCRPR